MIILKLILQICRMGNQCEIALRQMPYNRTNEKVMACCLTATSHYLSQCWHKYMSPYGVTRPQHFNRLRAELFWETINSFGYSIIYQNWQLIEILPSGRLGTVYPNHLMPWLLMSWRCKESRHQQPRHWLSCREYSGLSTRRDNGNGNMMTSSNGNIFRVTCPLCGEFTGPGEFPTQRPVTRSFNVFFDLRLNKRLSKQPWGWWFETPSWSLWPHCNECYNLPAINWSNSYYLKYHLGYGKCILGMSRLCFPSYKGPRPGYLLWNSQTSYL